MTSAMAAKSTCFRYGRTNTPTRASVFSAVTGGSSGAVSGVMAPIGVPPHPPRVRRQSDETLTAAARIVERAARYNAR